MGRRRTEIWKLPRSRPISSKWAAFSAPPLLDALAGLPPPSSATLGERLWASRGTLAAVPRTFTVRVRRSPGARGDESAFSDKSRNVMEKREAGCLAHDTSISARPGSRLGGGSTVNTAGEDASTSAGLPATRTEFASAWPQKPPRVRSNRSAREAKVGADETCGEAGAASAGVSMVA